jgi:hypothetical protein
MEGMELLKIKKRDRSKYTLSPLWRLPYSPLPSRERE